MSQIQITDLNPSDFGFMEELTDEELLAINGGKKKDGGLLSDALHATADAIDAAGDAVGDFIKWVF